MIRRKEEQRNRQKDGIETEEVLNAKLSYWEPVLNRRICSKGLIWKWRSWPAGSSGENELEQAEQETNKKKPKEQAKGRVGTGCSEQTFGTNFETWGLIVPGCCQADWTF